MKKMIVILMALACAGAARAVQSGDVVIVDDGNYVIVRQCEWAMVTNDVMTCMKVWDKLNATEEGRRAIHGKRGTTTITNGTITVEYEDGYKRTEAIPHRVNRVDDPNPPTVKRKPETAARPSRLEEILARRKAAKNAKPREVTIEVGGAK